MFGEMPLGGAGTFTRSGESASKVPEGHTKRRPEGRRFARMGTGNQKKYDVLTVAIRWPIDALVRTESSPQVV